MDNCWVHSKSLSDVPPDAVIGGHDSDGAVIYVGRTLHDGNYQPAKVIPSKNYVAISMTQEVIIKNQCDILTGPNYKWVPGKDGSVPQNAVIGGKAHNGEVLFIGRGQWEGSLTVGKIHPSNHSLYIAFESERKLNSYEVLTYSMDPGCRKSPSLSNTWVSASGSCVPKNAVLLDEENCIYVGRAFHKGALLPALVTPDKACAFVYSVHGKVEKFKFEVLIGDKYRWETAENGNVPPGTVEGSCTTKDEPLYIGRTRHLGFTAVGYVQQSDGCMYITVDGEEVQVKTYEVLVYRGNEKSFVDAGCKSKE